MLKTKYFFSLLILILVASCTISGEQEEQLNNQLGKYTKAHNNGQLLQLIGLTQPEAVRFYKEQGDSLFIQHFKDLKDGEKTYLVNPTYREMKAEGKLNVISGNKNLHNVIATRETCILFQCYNW
jgi:hypothetical protein